MLVFDFYEYGVIPHLRNTLQNSRLDWAEHDLVETLHELAIELTKLTLTIFDNYTAVSFYKA